jgi:hypothetical protein
MALPNTKFSNYSSWLRLITKSFFWKQHMSPTTAAFQEQPIWVYFPLTTSQDHRIHDHLSYHKGHHYPRCYLQLIASSLAASRPHDQRERGVHRSKKDNNQGVTPLYRHAFHIFLLPRPLCPSHGGPHLSRRVGVPLPVSTSLFVASYIHCGASQGWWCDVAPDFGEGVPLQTLRRPPLQGRHSKELERGMGERIILALWYLGPTRYIYYFFVKIVT